MKLINIAQAIALVTLSASAQAQTTSFVLGNGPTNSIPEPGVWALLGIGAIALLVRRFKG